MAPRTIGDATRTAALDASVLINFLCLERLDILAAIGDIDFVVPEQVVEEITVPQQIQTLNAAIRGGQLRSERSTTPDELASYANSASSWDGAKPLASPWRSNVAGSLRSTSAAVSSG